MDLRHLVWLASYPKSGNTWVRLLFDAYLLGEEPNINENVTSISDDHARRYQIGDGTDVLDLPLEYQLLARPMSALRLALAFNANRPEGLPLLVKTHCANMSASGIELLPHQLTKATIYLVRDPRDVAPSFAKHMGCDIDKAIEEMLKPNQIMWGKEQGKVADVLLSWPRNVESYWADDLHNTKIFRYEDLRKYPEEVFAKMLIHAGVKPDKERITKAVELTALERLRKQEKEKGFVEASQFQKDTGFFGKGKVGGWQSKLTEPQARRLERACEKQMRRLGYIGKKHRAAA